MKKFATLILAALMLPQVTMAWNKHLHTAVAAVAEANLTPQAREAIVKALGEQKITDCAYWMEEVSKQEKYKHTTAWHNVVLTPKGKILADKKANKSKVEVVRTADALEGINKAVTALQNRQKLSAAEVADNIRFVVHIMADLHCPSHYVFTDLLEQRNIKYKQGKKSRSYMQFWEGDVVTSTFGWKPREFVHQLCRLSDEQVAQLTAGSITDWVVSNAVVYRPIYSYVTNNEKFSSAAYREWLNKSFGMATDQIGVAGYRLAAVLNGLFDDNAPKKSVK